jgi:hypothetical protein
MRAAAVAAVVIVFLGGGARAQEKGSPADPDVPGPPPPIVLPAPEAREPPVTPASSGEPPVESYQLPGPLAGAYRWQLTASAGVAAGGAPSYRVGGGVGLSLGGTRVELSGALGWSSSTQTVPVNPSWSGSGDTYTSADWSARAFLFELTAARRFGAFELWAGGGVHVSIPQFTATYDYLACTDLLCMGPKYPATDTDYLIGSGATAPLVGTGVRVPLFEHVLLGFDLRWLAPATSRIGDRYDVAIRTGGFAISTALTVRLGEPLAR